MHYTGMAAARFTASDITPDLCHAVGITALGMAGLLFDLRRGSMGRSPAVPWRASGSSSHLITLILTL
jgi:hypothetical protein